jgi:hypothetical protein
MQNIATQSSKLPFNCRMLCVSLAVASFLLAIIISLYYLNYISTEIAMWATVSVFVAAAIYESFLLSLVARYMFKSANESLEES